MSHAQKIALIQAVAWIGAAYSFFIFDWPTILWVILLGYFIGVVGGIVGLHRYFSHRSFKVNRFWHYVLMFTATIQGLGFKNKEKALYTIEKIKDKDLTYQFNVINTMLNRAKHHPYKNKDMEEAIMIFEKWIKKNKKK